MSPRHGAKVLEPQVEPLNIERLWIQIYGELAWLFSSTVLHTVTAIQYVKVYLMVYHEHVLGRGGVIVLVLVG